MHGTEGQVNRVTDREKAIVMAYTGICMLEGKKLFEFYKYLEELYERPVYTHELLTLNIKERSEKDFMELCKREEPEQRWIPCEVRMPEEGEEVLTTYSSEDGVLISGVDHDITIALWRGEKHGWLLRTFVSPKYTVHAWMPMPERYKGE